MKRGVVLLLSVVFCGPAVAAEKTIGTSCNSDNSNIDWDTIGQCNGTIFQKGPLVLGAMASPPYSATTCTSSNAGMLQWTGTSFQGCDGLSWSAVGSSGNLLGTATSASNPQRSGDATTGLYSPSAGTVSVAVAGIEALRVTASGYVGIGTTAPDSHMTVGSSLTMTASSTTVPGSKVQIYDQPTATSDNQWTLKAVSEPTASALSNSSIYGLILIPETSTSAYTSIRGGTFGSVNYGSGTVSNQHGTANYVNHYSTGTITSQYAGYNKASNLSTGTVTSQFGGYNWAYNQAGGTVGRAYGSYNLVTNSTTGTITTAYGTYNIVTNSGSGTITNGYGVYIGSVAGTNSWALYSTATAPSYFAGNVGIGTTLPTSKLQVVGANSNISNTGTATVKIATELGAAGTVVEALHIDAFPDTAYDKGIALSFGWKNAYYGEYTSRIVHYGYASSTLASKLALQTHNSAGAWNTGILLDNNGHVGIGTTAPTGELNVYSASEHPMIMIESATGYYPHFALKDGNQTTDEKIFDWYSGGGVLYGRLLNDAYTSAVGWVKVVRSGMSVSSVTFPSGPVGIGAAPSYTLHVNGTAYATGAAGALSDARHKNNVESFASSGLEIISKLRPVTFKWKEPKDNGMKGTQIGFVAQEVEKVLPQVVLTEENAEKTKGLKYTEIIPVLAKAIQELNAVVEAQGRELRELKAARTK